MIWCTELKETQVIFIHMEAKELTEVYLPTKVISRT